MTVEFNCVDSFVKWQVTLFIFPSATAPTQIVSVHVSQHLLEKIFNHNLAPKNFVQVILTIYRENV